MYKIKIENIKSKTQVKNSLRTRIIIKKKNDIKLIFNLNA